MIDLLYAIAELLLPAVLLAALLGLVAGAIGCFDDPNPPFRRRWPAPHDDE